MAVSLFIARRYLFSKKSTNAINVISAISVVGVAVATMALVIVLSVFNGFHDLVASLFTAFDPQIEVVPAKGKDAPTDDPVLTQIKQLPEVDVATECVEDNALVFYGDKQAMVTIKGVDDNFTQLTHQTCGHTQTVCLLRRCISLCFLQVTYLQVCTAFFAIPPQSPYLQRK